MKYHPSTNICDTGRKNTSPTQPRASVESRTLALGEALNAIQWEKRSICQVEWHSVATRLMGRAAETTPQQGGAVRHQPHGTGSGV